MTKYVLTILDNDGSEITYHEFDGNPFAMEQPTINLYRKRIDQVVDLYGKGLWYPHSDRDNQ